MSISITPSTYRTAVIKYLNNRQMSTWTKGIADTLDYTLDYTNVIAVTDTIVNVVVTNNYTTLGVSITQYTRSMVTMLLTGGGVNEVGSLVISITLQSGASITTTVSVNLVDPTALVKANPTKMISGSSLIPIDSVVVKGGKILSRSSNYATQGVYTTCGIFTPLP